MPAIANSFDLQSVEWRRVTDPDCKAFRVDFDYSLLGYDLATGRLDMLLRYGKGCHCRRHRHVAATVTLVLQGEQHLKEMLPDGSTRMVRRKQGDYALAAADALPHDEWGGVLFEYFDENMANPWTLSIEEFVASWNSGGVYGAAPERSGVTAV